MPFRVLSSHPLPKRERRLLRILLLGALGYPLCADLVRLAFSRRPIEERRRRGIAWLAVRPRIEAARELENDFRPVDRRLISKDESRLDPCPRCGRSGEELRRHSRKIAIRIHFPDRDLLDHAAHGEDREKIVEDGVGLEISLAPGCGIGARRIVLPELDDLRIEAGDELVRDIDESAEDGSTLAPIPIF